MEFVGWGVKGGDCWDFVGYRNVILEVRIEVKGRGLGNLCYVLFWSFIFNRIVNYRLEFYFFLG